MFTPKNTETPSILLSAVRIVHAVLFCYAAGIIGIAFLVPGHGLSNTELSATALYRERFFAISVAAPMMVGSFFCFVCAVVRALFTPAIFFCTFLSVALATLPLMATLFFPMHMVGFALAAIYAFSAIILIRLCLSLPIPKKI